MQDQFSRTRKLLGPDGIHRLQDAHVCVFGVGGVGGFAVEALVRAGVGAIDIVDDDCVSITNLNRQIIATWDTIGRPKVEVMAERIKQINPYCKVTCHQCFYLPQTRELFDFASYDYIVDAIDTVSAKIDLVVAAQEAGTPIISSMGAGNKLDPTQLEVADIYQTSVCRLAKVMRSELRRRNIPSLTCVYSREPARTPYTEDEDETSPSGRPTPGSVSFVPSAAGLIIAGVVVRQLSAIDTH